MTTNPAVPATRPVSPLDASWLLEARLAMREVVLRGLREAQDARAAIDAYLMGVCSSLRWPAAVAYVIDPASPRMLTPTHQAYLDSQLREAAIHNVSLRPPAAGQQGLGARVLDTGEPAWVSDLMDSPHFTAGKYLEFLGARGGLAVPVYLGTRLGVVAEFYTRQPFHPEPGVLWSLAHVTSRLGTRIAELNRQSLGSSPGRANGTPL